MYIDVDALSRYILNGKKELSEEWKQFSGLEVLLWNNFSAQTIELSHDHRNLELVCLCDLKMSKSINFVGLEGF